MIEVIPDDCDGEIDQETMERVCRMVEAIVTSCMEIGEAPEDAFNALAGATAFVLSNSISTREGAEQATQAIHDLVLLTMDRAEQDGGTLWTNTFRH